jgi:enterochelin esterase-like enzyme
MRVLNAFSTTNRIVIISLALILCFSMSVPSRAEDSPSFNSHEVHPDGTVAFRYKDPAATKVLVHLDGVADGIPMTKGSDGLWSVVTSPLAPAIYGYIFESDGLWRLDPQNTIVKPNMLFLGNAVTVPGATPQLWQALDVPHGVVHHHFYTSKVVLGLPDGQSDYFVYTPPGFDAKSKKRYPVLYLLHGWSDLANGWTEVGEANFILDNLIAQGKAKPMLVVMPLGYGDMKFVKGGETEWHDDAAVNHNVSLFSQALFTEIMPQVESTYHASKKREDRAIAGLSMGGLESLTIGLTHTEQFAWVGGFSSALGHHERDGFSSLTGNAANLRLLWIACGTEDGLITPNREFVAWLKSKDVPFTAVETPGMHTWMVWRNNLGNFLPLLFR